LSRRLCALIGLGVAALLLASSQAGGSIGPATITITDLRTSFTPVDFGPHRASAGDLEIIRQRLYKHATSRVIGSADILCTLLSKTTSTCNGTYQLPKGTIVTSGVVGATTLLYEMAITGGTELYDNARGSLVVTTTSLKPRREVLVFRLTG
jgi:hypothetical protein